MFSHFAKSSSNSFLKQSKKHFGKNEKAIMLRIKSVTSIAKITTYVVYFDQLLGTGYTRKLVEPS